MAIAAPSRRSRWRGRRASLRWRTMTAFAVGGMLISTLLASATYLIVRGFLVGQREDSAIRQSYADASFVRDGLLAAHAEPKDVIGNVSPPAGSQIFVRVPEGWFASEFGGRRTDLPESLRATVQGGRPGMVWTTVNGQRTLVVGTPLPAVLAQFYEVTPVDELERTLGVLRGVLIGAGAVSALAAAVLGRSVAGRVVQPLDEVAEAAAAIAAGRMDTRLTTTDDPDLVAIVASFNTMVDALAARIERETRFTADVSHELRSPLTTLVTGVELLAARRHELPERAAQALDLVTRELDRFRDTLEDLLALARLDAGDPGTRTETDLWELAQQVLSGQDRDPAILKARPAGSRPATVLVDRRQLERALLNLIANADRYGGGWLRITVSTNDDSAYLAVDDDGPGVPVEDRERIFARFARGPAPRGSTRGTGLGLSLVAETVQQHGGAVWCTERPGGHGARFVLRLPLALLAALAVLTGCGVPQSGEVRPLSTAAVPYGLLKPVATPSPTGSAVVPVTTVGGKVAFIDRGGIRLASRSVQIGAAATVADELLVELARGPTPPERDRGFDSIVPPTSGLQVVSLVDGVAAVEISGDQPGQDADRLPIVFAQIVFTVTSVDGIDAVTLQRDGLQRDGFRGDGTVTLDPLTRRDYANLLK